MPFSEPIPFTLNPGQEGKQSYTCVLTPNDKPLLEGPEIGRGIKIGLDPHPS